MESRASSRLLRFANPMHPNQLNLLPPDHAAILIRKKRSWKMTMWISFATGGLTVLGGVLYYQTRMDLIDSSRKSVNIAADISQMLDVFYIVSVIFIPLTALCFLIFLVSIIRFLGLPKIPTSSNLEY